MAHGDGNEYCWGKEENEMGWGAGRSHRRWEWEKGTWANPPPLGGDEPPSKAGGDGGLGMTETRLGGWPKEGQQPVALFPHALKVHWAKWPVGPLATGIGRLKSRRDWQLISQMDSARSPHTAAARELRYSNGNRLGKQKKIKKF